ncbi:hypothetical protein KR222_009942, partial [Zaprionus bogoriensis]
RIITNAVYEAMNRYQLLATLTIVPALVVVGVRIVHKYVSARLQHGQQPELSEVRIFNEQSYDCVFDHHNHHRLRGSASQPYVCRNVYCSQRHTERIVEQLERAQCSIDLAMFSFSSFELCDALEAALRRGVKVRLIAANARAISERNVRSLIALGARTRHPVSNKLMHHKLCIIDSHERVADLLRSKSMHLRPRPTHSVVICGSANWTNGGFCANWENCLISSDKLLASQLQLEFNRMWRAF